MSDPYWWVLMIVIGALVFMAVTGDGGPCKGLKGQSYQSCMIDEGEYEVDRARDR
ncbi:MAG: hypothetical protein WCI61_04690 [Chloroflexota bacterium]